MDDAEENHASLHHYIVKSLNRFIVSSLQGKKSESQIKRIYG